MLSDIRLCEDIALFTNVPFEVLIVNKDIAYNDPCPISISLNLQSILTEIRYRVLALLNSYLHPLEDEVNKFDVDSWVQESIQRCRGVSKGSFFAPYGIQELFPDERVWNTNNRLNNQKIANNYSPFDLVWALLVRRKCRLSKVLCIFRDKHQVVYYISPPDLAPKILTCTVLIEPTNGLDQSKRNYQKVYD